MSPGGYVAAPSAALAVAHTFSTQTRPFYAPLTPVVVPEADPPIGWHRSLGSFVLPMAVGLVDQTANIETPFNMPEFILDLLIGGRTVFSSSVDLSQLGIPTGFAVNSEVRAATVGANLSQPLGIDHGERLEIGGRIVFAPKVKLAAPETFVATLYTNSQIIGEVVEPASGVFTYSDER